MTRPESPDRRPSSVLQQHCRPRRMRYRDASWLALEIGSSARRALPSLPPSLLAPTPLAEPASLSALLFATDLPPTTTLFSLSERLTTPAHRMGGPHFTISKCTCMNPARYIGRRPLSSRVVSLVPGNTVLCPCSLADAFFLASHSRSVAHPLFPRLMRMVRRAHAFLTVVSAYNSPISLCSPSTCNRRQASPVASYS